jgi:hypothetical protein
MVKLLTVDFTLFKSAVGNSPLILDESSDHGLGQRYHHLDATRYCSENSTIVSDHEGKNDKSGFGDFGDWRQP